MKINAFDGRSKRNKTLDKATNNNNKYLGTNKNSRRVFNDAEIIIDLNTKNLSKNTGVIMIVSNQNTTQKSGAHRRKRRINLRQKVQLKTSDKKLLRDASLPCYREKVEQKVICLSEEADRKFRVMFVNKLDG